MSFTTRTVQYIPFRETSFGFGSGAVAAAQTQLNPTDIVRVDINTISGSNFSDLRDGHISTPSVGTAISVFNGFNNVWTVRGELADVDAVLAQLSYFPSDYETTRTWTPTALKDNQTTGVYLPTTGTGGEEPPAIPDDDFLIKIYDSNNQILQSNIITFEAHQYDYGNSRPYWSVEPVLEDVSGGSTYNHIDLGTIANTPAEENVTLSCEFRNWGSTSAYTGSAYGNFSSQTRFYVSDKKEGTRDNTSNRFNFTGSLIEAQAFLDNIRYNRGSNRQIFDMFLKISDGVVGSTVTKTCWHSDSPFTASHQLPDLVGTEEQYITGLNADPNFNITHSPEVNRYWFTITLDSTGQDGITAMSEGTLTNGVYTSDYSYSIESLRAKMLTITMSLREDFNDDFTFNIQYHGDNTTLGTSYSSTPQTVNVTMTDTLEISNLITSHSFSEDSRYTFSDGAGLPNIAHGYNRDYTARITASDPNAVEVIWTGASGYTSGTDFFWENGDQLRMVGTRDEVNEMLNAVYFESATDYDQNFSFSYKQTRLSGDTTSDAAEGDFYNIEIGANNCISMTCAVSHDEYSFTASTQNWDEDVSKLFDTGIRVTDLSDEHEYTTSYQTEYTVTLKMVDASGNDFNSGILEHLSGTLTSNTGNGKGSDPRVMTGSKTEINTALANMKYIPDADITDQFWVQFKIVRDFDSAVLADYSDTRQITFNTATGHDEYSFTSSTQDWSEDVSKLFDTQIQVTDLSDLNPDMATYQTDYTVYMKMVDASGNDYNYGSLTSTSTGGAQGNLGGSNPKTYTGTKAQVNQAITNMKYVPEIDITDGFFVQFKIVRVNDNSTLVDYDQSRQITFNTATAHDEYTHTTDNIVWYEDIPKVFDSNLRITDLSDENPDMRTYQTNYQITARLKYWDGSNAQPLTTAQISSANYGSATVSGTGTVADPFVMTGDKTTLNTALANLIMTPDPEFTHSPETNGNFWVEFKLERIEDNAVLLNYALSTSFLAGIGHEEFILPSPTSYYVKDNTASVNTTGNPLFTLYSYNNTHYGGQAGYWQIGDQLGDPNTQTYNLKMSISDVGDLHYGTTLVQGYYTQTDFVESDYLTNELDVVDTRSSINTKLTTLNYFNDEADRIINVKLTRMVDSKLLFDQDHQLTFVEMPEIDVSTGITYNDIWHIYDAVNDDIVAEYTYSGDDSVIGGSSSPAIIETTNFTNSSKTTEVTDSNYYNIGSSLEYSFDNIDRVNDTVTFDRGTPSSALRHPAYQKLDIHMNIDKFRSKPFTIEKDYYSLYDTSSTIAYQFPFSVGFRRSTSDSNILDTQFFHYRVPPDTNPTLRAYTYGVSGTSNKEVQFFGTGPYRDYESNKNRLEGFLLVEMVHSNTAPNYYFDVLQVTPFLNNSSSTLQRDTSNSVVVSNVSTNEFAIIRDTLIHNNKLWIYVEYSWTQHYIFSVDLNSDDTLSSTPNPTLHKTFQNHPDNGYVTLGVAGDEVIYVQPSPYNDVYIYHQNTGGTNNFGLHTTITKTDWDQTISSTQRINSYYDNHWVKANKNGYISLGAGLYYYNNNTWTEVVDASLYPPDSSWISYPDVFHWGVLTRDYYFNPNNFKMMKLNGLNPPTEVVDIETLPSGYDISKLEGNRNFNTVVLKDTQENIYILSLT